MTTTNEVTYKDMCELISEFLLAVHGVRVPPESIWSYSPAGELSLVFELYAAARSWSDAGRPLPCCPGWDEWFDSDVEWFDSDVESGPPAPPGEL